MKAYSSDLRERVVRACDAGRQTRQQIAALFGVSTAWIRRLLQRRRETGSFAAKKLSENRFQGTAFAGVRRRGDSPGRVQP